MVEKNSRTVFICFELLIILSATVAMNYSLSDTSACQHGFHWTSLAIVMPINVIDRPVHVKGTIDIVAESDENMSPTQVSFYFDGQFLYADHIHMHLNNTTFPYFFSCKWDTTTVEDGLHELNATGMIIDENGTNRTLSSEHVSVLVKNSQQVLSAIYLLPKTAMVRSMAARRFIVSAFDQYDRPINSTSLNITWSVEGGIGIVGPDGGFRATDPGIGRVQVVVRRGNSGLTARSNITVIGSEGSSASKVKPHNKWVIPFPDITTLSVLLVTLAVLIGRRNRNGRG